MKAISTITCIGMRSNCCSEMTCQVSMINVENIDKLPKKSSKFHETLPINFTRQFHVMFMPLYVRSSFKSQFLRWVKLQRPVIWGDKVLKERRQRSRKFSRIYHNFTKRFFCSRFHVQILEFICVISTLLLSLCFAPFVFRRS